MERFIFDFYVFLGFLWIIAFLEMCVMSWKAPKWRVPQLVTTAAKKLRVFLEWTVAIAVTGGSRLYV